MPTLDPKFQLPALASSVGFTIGLFRGSRKSGLQYLAENAHKAPTTVKGWYLYKKQKNIRMILGGFTQAGRDGVLLAALGTGWVATEEGLKFAGLGDFREPAAGLAVAAAVSAAYRLPFRRVAVLAVAGGLCKLGLRLVAQAQKEAGETGETA
ncbi:hypothetical protein EXIGLDRAFT_758398 [Exidia glandulosa HHB12029]|uniref:Uncharacterized protein n=1 Tax=Exidia glandulosa HHB12029 TaxID=1314781 RepID=A0A165QUN6_EXIGL|nr:hypothetical protein EXIGLDRAFT_758398 [Exidia glandulosa HHB12029]